MREAIDAEEVLGVAEWIDGLNDVEARISAQVIRRRRAHGYLICKILVSGLVLYGSSKAGLLTLAATLLLGFAVVLFSFEWTRLRGLKKEREAILAQRDYLNARQETTRRTRPMRYWVLCLAFSLLATPGTAPGQERTGTTASQMARMDRVVVHSPHFDVPLPRWQGLSCPAGPLHLYGFEGGTEEVQPALRIRSFLYNPTLRQEHVALANSPGGSFLEPISATVAFTHRIAPTGEEALPFASPWIQMTDSTGLAVFSIPDGIYRVRFDYLGTGQNEGIIRVRAAQADSVHAYLIPGAVCNQQ